MKKKDINSAYEENPVEDSPAEEPSGKKKKGKDRHSMDDLAGKGETAILRLFYKKRRKKYYEALY